VRSKPCTWRAGITSSAASRFARKHASEARLTRISTELIASDVIGVEVLEYLRAECVDQVCDLFRKGLAMSLKFEELVGRTTHVLTISRPCSLTSEAPRAFCCFFTEMILEVIKTGWNKASPGRILRASRRSSGRR